MSRCAFGLFCLQKEEEMTMVERHWHITKPLRDAYGTGGSRRVRLVFKIEGAANAAVYLDVMTEHRIFVVDEETRERLNAVRRTGNWGGNRVLEVVLGSGCGWNILGTVAGGLATYAESGEGGRGSGGLTRP